MQERIRLLEDGEVLEIEHIMTDPNGWVGGVAQHQELAASGLHRYQRGRVSAGPERQPAEHAGRAGRAVALGGANDEEPDDEDDAKSSVLGGRALPHSACSRATLALAHHSTSAFDNDTVVKVEGTVTQFRWINPHASFKVDGVAEGDAPDGLWTVEMTAANVLLNQGWRRTSLRIGDEVTIYVNPLRNAITLNDGSPGRTVRWRRACRRHDARPHRWSGRRGLAARGENPEFAPRPARRPAGKARGGLSAPRSGTGATGR